MKATRNSYEGHILHTAVQVICERRRSGRSWVARGWDAGGKVKSRGGGRGWVAGSWVVMFQKERLRKLEVILHILTIRQTECFKIFSRMDAECFQSFEDYQHCSDSAVTTVQYTQYTEY